MTEKEKLYITKHYPRKSAAEIGRVLNLPRNTVISYATRAGLKKDIKTYGVSKSPEWSEEEISFLVKNYQDSSISDLMQKLKRTKWAITSKKLELKKAGLT